jgi:peptidoglycan glycosyltransferase
MNSSIQKLFVIVILLFALLVAWTSRWTVFNASALQNAPLNSLAYFRSLTVQRGRILADDGTQLAKSVKAGGGTWSRKYPERSLFSQTVGYYDAVLRRRAGLERSRNTSLEGTPTGISSVFGSIGVGRQVGDDVETTLDPKAQELARTLLAGRAGSVIAIVPQTGAVPVMYSNPTYDDNNPNCKTVIDGIGCQLNLATQAHLPPGSTFKVVTTTAALDSGRYTPNSTIVGNSPITVSGVPLENDGNQSWGPVSLTTALTNSINTVYAQVGEALGKQIMSTYMKRFGFYATPPLDLPAAEMEISGERKSNGALLPATSDLVDVGRMAIGQDKLAVTPLQMAMVAATVANGGTLMKPRLTNRIVNPDGVVVKDFKPTVYRHVMKPSVAGDLTTMMTKVVEEGTGTAANLEGMTGQVAGKTGTATVQTGSNRDDAWFIGFYPASHPKIAVAVTLLDIPNGYGGVYAAPIAAQMMKKLYGEGL